MRTLRSYFLGTLALTGLPAPAGSQPVGEEFQVNTYTTHWQTDPSVALDATSLATTPLSLRSFSLIVVPLARWRAWVIDGSEERSHEHVFNRSGRPNELRNVLWILVSGSCRLRQPGG